MNREHIDLMGPWRFQVDSTDEGELRRYFDPEYDATYFREVTVPCTFDECGPGMASYEGVGWYRRMVMVPSVWQGKRIILRFEGANYRTVFGSTASLPVSMTMAFSDLTFPCRICFTTARRMS